MSASPHYRDLLLASARELLTPEGVMLLTH
jgi:hypothetical protein